MFRNNAPIIVSREDIKATSNQNSKKLYQIAEVRNAITDARKSQFKKVSSNKYGEIRILIRPEDQTASVYIVKNPNDLFSTIAHGECK